MEQEPHLPNYAELRKAQEEAEKQRQQEEAEKQRQQEPIRPEQLRSPGWTAHAGMEAQQASAREYNAWLNQPDQRKEQFQPETTNALEATPANEQRPEESRPDTKNADAANERAASDAKKADEQEFDMKRFMSDPDYRRQMKEQRQADQSERTESREQEAERVATSGRQL